MPEQTVMPQEMYNMLLERQKIRRRNAIDDIGSGLHLTAARAPDSRKWAQLQSKVATAQPALQALAQSEQHYFDKEFEARQNALNQKIAAARDAVQAALQKYSVGTNSAMAAAANNMTSRARQMAETQRRLDMLEGTSPKGRLTLDELRNDGLLAARGARGGGGGGGVGVLSGNEALGQANQILIDMQADLRAVPTDSNGMRDPQHPDMMKAQETLAGFGMTLDDLDDEDGERLFEKKAAHRLQALDRARRESEGTAPGQPAAPQEPADEKVLQHILNAMADQADPAVAGSDILAILDATGLSSEEARAVLEANGLTEEAAAMEQSLQANRERKQEYRQSIDQGLQTMQREGAQTWASTDPVNQALAALDQLNTQVTQEAAARRARVVGQVPPGQPGQPGAEQATDEDGQPITPETQNFYDIIGDTSGSAPERMERTLQAIEEYSHLPPAQQLKEQVMGKYGADYMKARGISDPDLAFRMMNREVRMARRQGRSNDRKAYEKLRKAGKLTAWDTAELEQEEAPPRPGQAEQAMADSAVNKTQAGLAKLRTT